MFGAQRPSFRPAALATPGARPTRAPWESPRVLDLIRSRTVGELRRLVSDALGSVPDGQALKPRQLSSRHLEAFARSVALGRTTVTAGELRQEAQRCLDLLGPDANSMVAPGRLRDVIRQTTFSPADEPRVLPSRFREAIRHVLGLEAPVVHLLDGLATRHALQKDAQAPAQAKAARLLPRATER